MILHDPYALHRNWWEPWLSEGIAWVPDHTSRDWTDWDYTLADAFQTIEDFTDSESGQFIPYDASGDVDWDAQVSTSGYLEAVRKYEDAHELKPGERVYAVPSFRYPDNKPTLESWAKDQEDGVERIPSEQKGARPPTPEELRAMSGSG